MNDALITPRPAILTTGVDYSRESLSPFILTCLRYIPTAVVVLFASRLTRDTIDWLDGLPQVHVVHDDFNPRREHRGWRLVADQLRTRLAYEWSRALLHPQSKCPAASERLAEAYFSVVIQRFFRYRRFLSQRGHHFTHVMLTDCRDVRFQANPFPCESLHAFAEDETIGSSHFARRWFQLTYGRNSWKPFRDRQLLNVGTTLGDVASVQAYLDCMCSEFYRLRAFFWGVDTAVHNRIIHQGTIAALVNAFGEGAVLTLNSIKRTSLNVSDGYVVNALGTPYPVLHQYDRVRGLVDELRLDSKSP